jgi:ABC-2 type transport system permease protein
MFLLSGALFPVTGLPSFLQVAVYLDPLTYGVDALRQVILGYGALPLYVSTIVVVGFALLTIALSATLFSKKEQNLM